MSAAAEDVLAANIRQRRTALGLGLRELSRKCGLAPSTVFNAEHGIALTMRTLQRLAEGLGCTMTGLMTEPACPFCRDVPPPGYACGTCGTGDCPPASMTPVPDGLIGDLAALVSSGDVEAVTDEYGVLRFQPTEAAS
jgi:hypothetical protein